jgi:hypothetical protein
MSVWSFDVQVASHDQLKAGTVAGWVKGSQHRHHRVVVEAPSFTEAFQDVACMAGLWGEVTSIALRV